jgi:hypothetical protein
LNFRTNNAVQTGRQADEGKTPHAPFSLETGTSGLGQTVPIAQRTGRGLHFLRKKIRCRAERQRISLELKHFILHWVGSCSRSASERFFSGKPNNTYQSNLPPDCLCALSCSSAFNALGTSDGATFSLTPALSDKTPPLRTIQPTWHQLTTTYLETAPADSALGAS